MTLDDFNTIIEKRINIIRQSLAEKGHEYADNDTDRLIAFKNIAKLRRTTTVDAVGGVVAKQIVSLFDMIDKTTKCVNNQDQDQFEYVILTKHLWEEKIKDIINYMILLDAVIQDIQESEG